MSLYQCFGENTIKRLAVFLGVVKMSLSSCVMQTTQNIAHYSEDLTLMTPIRVTIRKLINRSKDVFQYDEFSLISLNQRMYCHITVIE